jgi:putative phosphoesterase
MRIALISDLHANTTALEALADVVSGADRVVCLGDLVGYYCGVNEVIGAVREMGALCVLGNHDDFLLHGCPADAPEAVRWSIGYADRVIDPGHRDWLAKLPLAWGGNLGGTTWLAVHGSPWSPLGDYIYADSPKLQGLAAFDYDVVALGQTHRPLQRMDGRPRLVNPGSVGQSRHAPAVACAAVVDTETMACEAVERPYDPSRVIEAARRNGASHWITKHLV